MKQKRALLSRARRTLARLTRGTLRQPTARPPRRYKTWTGLQALEAREMLSVSLVSAVPNFSAVSNQGATLIDLSSYFDDPEVLGKVVKFDTVMGDFYAELFDVANGSRTAAPLSTTQFLNHVNNSLLPGSATTRFSSYDNTLIHRSDKNVGVIQGGGFAYPGFTTQPQGPTVNNEYSETRPNTRGTIAFAKVGGNPNSATNQWFINTKDNTTVLGPANNGGFSTFGQVLGEGMTIVDAIANLPTVSGTSLNPSMGTQLPVRNTPPSGTGPNNVVLVNAIREVPDVLFSATSSDPGLVHVASDEQGLVLNFGVNKTGTATITVRATDHTGEFTETTFTVTVGTASFPPTVTTLKPNSMKVSRGNTITLTANGVADAVGNVTRVEFYRDSNGNGLLEPGVDTLVGTDTTAADGWTYSTPTAGAASGNYTYFARAIDDANQGSSPVIVTVEVTNAAPKLRSIPTLGTALHNQSTTIIYQTLAHFSDVSDANGDTISFRIEQVLNGAITKNGEPVVAGTTMIGPGESVVWTPPAGSSGTLNVFSFRASDGELVSPKAATLSFIVNRPPTVSALTASPRPLSQPGGAITLSAKANDSDGVVARVEFYFDSNGNGVLDPATDLKLGQDTDPRGGWSITTTNTSTLTAGQEARYFARAIDNHGQASDAITTTGLVNVPPTAGTFSTTAPVTRPGNITLTLADVVDSAGGSIRGVDFYLDTDASSTFTPDDTFLGKGVLQPGTNTYTLTIGTENIPAGSTRFIARAIDNDGGVATKTVTATITARSGNVVPIVTALTTKTLTVNRNQVITLTATGVGDSDSGVRYVEFYRDNGDGLFNPANDTLVARDYSSKDGWSTTHTIPNSLAVGTRRFFVRVVDLDNANSEVKSLDIQVNAPPTVGSLSAPATLAKGAKLTLTAVNVADTLGGTIQAVEFFHDTNRNGIFDAADKRVAKGKATTAGYVGAVATKKLLTGANRFFVRAIDNHGATSSTATAVVTLT